VKKVNEKRIRISRVEEMLEIEVCEIKGECPVHKVGDKIVIDGPRTVLEKTDAVCIHAFSSLLHYVIALDEGVDPRKLGLSKEEKNAYIQCVDPGEPYTSGGTVIFRCRRIEKL
jgi:uncharacterized repeat protein (TIGR04076 family)